MRLPTIYPFCEARFRVDTEGTCVDQRREFIDYVAEKMMAQTLFPPISYHVRVGPDPYFELPLTVRLRPSDLEAINQRVKVKSFTKVIPV